MIKIERAIRSCENQIQKYKKRLDGADFFRGSTYNSVELEKVKIQALEKQIPKKPDFEGDGYADGYLVYDTWICPYCEKHYEVDYDDYKHCPDCGQLIDWSDKQ